jgi:hypothetical protein
MTQKLLGPLMLIIGVLVLGGFVVLAVWDIPVAKKEVVKTVDTSKLWQKKL